MVPTQVNNFTFINSTAYIQLLHVLTPAKPPKGCFWLSLTLVHKYDWNSMQEEVELLILPSTLKQTSDFFCFKLNRVHIMDTFCQVWY